MFQQSQFSWYGPNRSLVTEISDLGRNPFTMRSSIQVKMDDGRVVEFFPVGIDRNGEGELTGWRLRSEKEKLNMLIIND